MARDIAITEMRCKSTAIQTKTPVKLTERAKNLLFCTNSADCALRKVRTSYHFTAIVIRKFVIHQRFPFSDKLPFEVTEGERDPVTFNALNPAYHKQDLKGLFDYDVRNVVGFILIAFHCAFVCASMALGLKRDGNPSTPQALG